MDSLLIAIVVVAVVWMTVSAIVRHNLRTCPRCKGTRKARSSMFSSRYRVCPRCGGKGEVRAAFGRRL